MSWYLEYNDDNGQSDDQWAMKVNLIGCKNCPSWALEAAFEGVKHAHNEIYSDTDVPGTRVLAYTSEFVANSCDAATERSDANDWLDDNGFSGNELYLFVSNCKIATTYGHAWRGRCVGFVGAGDYDAPNEMSVMAIHESLHAFILESCDFVQDLADESSNNANAVDHRLGQIISVNGTDKASPMCASYAKDPNNPYASSGQCDNYSNISWGDWTKYLTWCTKDAIDDTLNHIQ